MEIVINNLHFKSDNKIVEGFNITLQSNRIIGIYGNRYLEFINDIKNNNLDSETTYFKNAMILNHNYHFLTNNVRDEMYLSIKDYIKNENTIIDMLEFFKLDSNYLNRDIYSLSSTERKIIKLIIAYLSDAKTIVIDYLFNGLDYNYMKLFKMFIKKIRDNDKLVFIHEDDIDLIYSFVDRFMIVDTNLITINTRNKVLENENINNISGFSIPKLYQIQQLLKKKNINIGNCYSVRELIKEVKMNA